MKADIRYDSVLTEKLHIPAEFLRPSYTTRRDQQLEKAIKEDGITQVVIVLESEGVFKVIKGTRRVTIGKRLSIPRIVCGILTLPAGKEEMSFMRRERLALNEHAQSLMPTQVGGLVNKIKAVHKFNNPQVAQKLGVTGDTIGNWTDILKMPAEIQNAVDSGKVKEHAVRSLRALKPEAQLELFKRHEKEFLTPDGIKKLQSRINKEYSPERHPEMYVAPRASATARKVAQQAPKTRRVTKNYSPEEKRKLIGNLGLQETELRDNKAEIAALKAVNARCIPAVDVMLKTKAIRSLLSEDMVFELEAFASKYV